MRGKFPASEFTTVACEKAAIFMGFVLCSPSFDVAVGGGMPKLTYSCKNSTAKIRIGERRCVSIHALFNVIITVCTAESVENFPLKNFIGGDEHFLGKTRLFLAIFVFMIKCTNK